jgi:hypothetical protein
MLFSLRKSGQAAGGVILVALVIFNVELMIASDALRMVPNEDGEEPVRFTGAGGTWMEGDLRMVPNVEDGDETWMEALPRESDENQNSLFWFSSVFVLSIILLFCFINNIYIFFYFVLSIILGLLPSFFIVYRH